MIKGDPNKMRRVSIFVAKSEPINVPRRSNILKRNVLLHYENSKNEEPNEIEKGIREESNSPLEVPMLEESKQ